MPVYTFFLVSVIWFDLQYFQVVGCPVVHDTQIISLFGNGILKLSQQFSAFLCIVIGKQMERSGSFFVIYIEIEIDLSTKFSILSADENHASLAQVLFVVLAIVLRRANLGQA